MTRYRAFVTTLLVFGAALMLSPVTQGQAVTPQPTPATLQPTPPPPSPVGMRNVQVDVTVKLEGSGTPITKQMTLVGADGSVSMGRAGMDVPVSVGPSNQYRSVGLNVDARPRLVEGGRIGLNLKLEVSAVVKADGPASTTPSFNSSKTELSLVLESGKPLVIAHAADAEVGRGYTVEVKATLLK
jgi:hypothetical protein